MSRIGAIELLTPAKAAASIALKEVRVVYGGGVEAGGVESGVDGSASLSRTGMRLGFQVSRLIIVYLYQVLKMYSHQHRLNSE